MSVPVIARFVAGKGQTLDGSGRVTAWADQSGQGNDALASTSQPPVADVDDRGRAVVRFSSLTGVTSRLTLAAPTLDVRNLTAVFIGRPLYVSGNLLTLPSYAFPTSSMLRWTNVGNIYKLYSYGIASPVKPRSNTQCLVWRGSASASRIGSNADAAFSGAAPTAGSSANAVLLPAADVEAHEVVLLTGAATDADVTALMAYAGSAWSVRQTAYVKQMVTEGDSIAQGVGSTFMLGYPSHVVDRPGLTDWRMTQRGTSGASLSTLSARADGIDALLEPGWRNVLSGFIGRNDFAGATPPAASTVYANLVTYLQARVAAGWEVWWGTPIASASSIQPALDSFVSLLRGTPNGGTGPGIVADAGIARLLDYNALPHFQTSADSNNTTYYQADQTHPTAVGAKALADYLAGVMAAA